MTPLLYVLAAIGAWRVWSYFWWFFAGLPYVGYREWRADR